MFYLSTETIEKAYNALTSVELEDQGANAMFYFLILKACGINRISYETPNFSEKKGFYYASRISSLFAPTENSLKVWLFKPFYNEVMASAAHLRTFKKLGWRKTEK